MELETYRLFYSIYYQSIGKHNSQFAIIANYNRKRERERETVEIALCVVFVVMGNSLTRPELPTKF